MKSDIKIFHLVLVVIALTGFSLGRSASGSGQSPSGAGDPAVVAQDVEQSATKETGTASEITGEEIITIAGTVTENFQVVTGKGIKYDIAENKEGEEMLKHVGENVTVKGRLTIINEQKLLTVISYELSGK